MPWGVHLKILISWQARVSEISADFVARGGLGGAQHPPSSSTPDPKVRKQTDGKAKTKSERRTAAKAEKQQKQRAEKQKHKKQKSSRSRKAAKAEKQQKQQKQKSKSRKATQAKTQQKQKRSKSRIRKNISPKHENTRKNAPPFDIDNVGRCVEEYLVSTCRSIKNSFGSPERNLRIFDSPTITV